MAVVIDANVALALVLPLPYSPQVDRLWDQWEQSDQLIYAPDLWGYEILSGLRQAEVIGGLDAARVDEALDILLALPVRLVPAALGLQRTAYSWARRLNRKTAYDASYLALAEVLQCGLWTADGRLARSAGAYVDWVHLVKSDR